MPSCPNQSVVNAVVHLHAAALRTARSELEAAYVRAGAGVWRVWVLESDRTTAEWLEQPGHRLTGKPRAMTIDLAKAEFGVSGELDWERTSDGAGTWLDVSASVTFVAYASVRNGKEAMEMRPVGMRRTGRRLSVLCLAVVATVVAASGATGEASVTGRGALQRDRPSRMQGMTEAQRTALAVTAAGPPLAVDASDGREHIEYDLLITNALDSPVTLRSLEVFDGRGRRLLRLRGDALANATHELLRSPPTATIPASGTVATMVDVVTPERHLPTRLIQRIRYGVPADAPSRNEIGSLVVRGPSLRISRRAAVVIAPPLGGGGWLGINAACCDPSGHREALFPANGQFVKPETFAIDWLRLRGDRLYAGDGSETSQWYGEGAPLLAVADGTVVRAVDGRPEIRPAPFGRPNLRHPDEFDGNYVVVRIRPGVFAFYAHMRPGTIHVHVGERVRTGQRLGELGNSGQTTAPHLHFSVQDGPNPGASNSIPFEIDRYCAVGTGRLVPVGSDGAVDPRVPIRPIAGSARAQVRTYPLNGVLARFRNVK